MDTFLIILLTAAVIGVSAIVIKDKKKGGCASCPYNDACPSQKQCNETREGMKQ